MELSLLLIHMENQNDRRSNGLFDLSFPPFTVCQAITSASLYVSDPAGGNTDLSGQDSIAIDLRRCSSIHRMICCLIGSWDCGTG